MIAWAKPGFARRSQSAGGAEPFEGSAFDGQLLCIIDAGMVSSAPASGMVAAQTP
jgi:hypothetical protein